MEVRSSFATRPVCTVTTPLFTWYTLNQAMPPSTSTMLAPIPTFCHVFIALTLRPAPRGMTVVLQHRYEIRADDTKCFSFRRTCGQKGRRPYDNSEVYTLSCDHFSRAYSDVQR